MRKKIVAGNWKMNKTLDEGLQLVDEILKLESKSPSQDVLKIIAPPYLHLMAVADKLKDQNGFEVAAQNCHHKEQGAFTGEVSARMIASTKSKSVLIGHSERRQYFNETNEQLAEKIKLALIHQLKPVFCIGENLEERSANRYFEVIQQQLKEALFSLNPKDFANVIIAYEPVWAIGTGNTASTEQVQEIHSYIRGLLQKQYGTEIASLVPILYGGSCNATNAKALFSCEDVDGGLIGGASLLAEDFVKIIKSF